MATAPAPAPADIAIPKKTDDQLRIAKLLGTTYSVAPFTQPLVGRAVLIKYGTKVWHLATVDSQVEEDEDEVDMFNVTYDDKQPGQTRLGRDLVWDVSSVDEAPRWSWLLLDAAPLSNHGDRVREAKSSNIGRKRQHRFAPAAGPTSKHPKSKP
jgi:hypothetical protein